MKNLKHILTMVLVFLLVVVLCDEAFAASSFCNKNLGVFSGLVKSGQDIFNRLRDLIYVVAGFGIIAVAVGGFFGNLNWKWLGAIVISLVVIASAGEIIVLITGCEQFSQTLVTSTLKASSGARPVSPAK